MTKKSTRCRVLTSAEKKALRAAEEERNEVNKEFILVGRGFEDTEQIFRQTDPLSLRFQEAVGALSKLMETLACKVCGRLHDKALG